MPGSVVVGIMKVVSEPIILSEYDLCNEAIPEAIFSCAVMLLLIPRKILLILRKHLPMPKRLQKCNCVKEQIYSSTSE